MMSDDVFQRVMLLFCRVLQRDSTERPRFMVEPLPGGEWGAAVYLGSPLHEIRAHYARQRGVKFAREGSGDAYCAASAPSPPQALAELERVLKEDLRARIAADLATWEIATGQPWPGVAPVVRVEARPETPDPHDHPYARRAPKLLPVGFPSVR